MAGGNADRRAYTPGFDPFNDRWARDIRNTLSSALVAELEGAPDAIDTQVRHWLGQVTAPLYRDFIHTRCARYRRIVNRILAEGIEDPRRQAVLLWNAGLFFELHELLETIWLKVPQPERTGLKGLIQAAGAYVHQRRGKAAAARALAGKARMNLGAGAAALTFIGNLDELLAELARLETPPQLKSVPAFEPEKNAS
jgi:uncharacterized protein